MGGSLASEEEMLSVVYTVTVGTVRAGDISKIMVKKLAI